jgi:hypothetical protein
MRIKDTGTALIRKQYSKTCKFPRSHFAKQVTMFCREKGG